MSPESREKYYEEKICKPMCACVRKMIPDCFDFLSAEYKEGREIEDKNSEEEILESVWPKTTKGLDCGLERHTLDGDHKHAVVPVSCCAISSLSTIINIFIKT